METLRNLMLAYIRAESDGSRPGKTVREFVSEFRGLSGTAKQKCVTEKATMSGACLRDLAKASDIPAATVKRLLEAMQAESRPVNPKALGVIGLEHLTTWLVAQHCESESVRYKMIAGESDGLPFVLEIAFGVYSEDFRGCSSEIAAGLNWSPCLGMPFEQLSSLLGECRIDRFDPVVVVVHLACPRLEFVDRGKSRLNIPQEIETALEQALRSVTKAWKVAKRQADKNDRLMQRQLDEMRKVTKRASLSIKEAAYKVMPKAYQHASADGKFPANARQIMYAARPLVLELTGGKCWKDSAYFTQKLLPEFVEKHPELTAAWDVVYDARGKLVEPHTGVRIDLGTLAVRQYLAEWRENFDGSEILTGLRLSHRIKTMGPANRYRFALFVEKEGFNELLDAIQLAERYDLAIMSTKGMSVTAARRLVAELSKSEVTILVLHDFDKAGFSIVNSLRSSTRRWRYEVAPRVIDLGLRLTDVNVLSLQSEPVTYRSSKDPRDNLAASGATEEECDFLVRGNDQGNWYGERVEINAMTSEQLVGWLEGKLQEIGARKVIPDDEVLKCAYQRAYRIARMKRAIDEAASECNDTRARCPKRLRNLIHEKLDNSVRAWDDVVFDLASEAHQQYVHEKVKHVGRIKRRSN